MDEQPTKLPRNHGDQSTKKSSFESRRTWAYFSQGPSGFGFSGGLIPKSVLALNSRRSPPEDFDLPLYLMAGAHWKVSKPTFPRQSTIKSIVSPSAASILESAMLVWLWKAVHSPSRPLTLETMRARTPSP